MEHQPPKKLFFLCFYFFRYSLIYMMIDTHHRLCNSFFLREELRNETNSCSPRAERKKKVFLRVFFFFFFFFFCIFFDYFHDAHFTLLRYCRGFTAHLNLAILMHCAGLRTDLFILFSFLSIYYSLTKSSFLKCSAMTKKFSIGRHLNA